MKRRACLALLLCCAALAARGAPSASQRFAVIGHGFTHGGTEARLERALADVREPDLAFVVATGIKGEAEPCSDTLYTRRREMFNDALRPLIVAPAASDWSGCRNSAGRSAAIERLNRLRELFYPEPYSLGARRIPLTRLSSSPRFRSYPENAHWVIGRVLYATVNLPANNNHYLAEAGRNSEFEDRLVANRFWLIRLFTLARRTRLDAVVLFSEGDVKILSEKPGLLSLWRRPSGGGQDGFAEPRRLIGSLAQKFGGKVLLIDTAPLAAGAQPAIAWRGNLGHLSVGSEVVKLTVEPGAAPMFALDPVENSARGERADKADR